MVKWNQLVKDLSFYPISFTQACL